jgi:hypothetical protein
MHVETVPDTKFPRHKSETISSGNPACPSLNYLLSPFPTFYLANSIQQNNQQRELPAETKERMANSGPCSALRAFPFASRLALHLAVGYTWGRWKNELVARHVDCFTISRGVSAVRRILG